ncbi:MAG: LptF/LptG family permease [Candidatus Aminicenantes bacterium]|nr:LptF/LptG family permease [Candidatus Aminicenantes bacterium]NIM83249.1 LptF/LptG family permease [Candidatus Aminicenantes bacterium]NIN22620.1 LptF/LptG family permease [Candidatus Aminicenantes bacterium]NIN46379.1 LptF/LptG family permease [Candidatus Aminicenantes bacterium]NIN89229.1 LptF/LptG family permease [Candidatus Aminicenantes bacterium]
MKSFDKYILKEIASPFGIGLLVYTFTLLINMIFVLSDTLIAKEASILTVLEILAYMLPDFLSFTIPMSSLMGVLAGLSRMSTDSEIVAFKTMGVSNLRILKPIMIFAVINWLFSSWLIMYMAPEAGFRLSKIWVQLTLKRTAAFAKPGDFYKNLPYYTLYFNDVDRDTDEWKGVFLYSKKRGDTDTIILAKRGKFIQSLEEKDSWIFLKDVLVHSFQKKEPDESYDITQFVSKKETVPNPVEMKQTRKERQLVFPELVKRIKKQPKNRLLSIEFQRKFALPFACLALAFLALSLGISTKKGGKVSGFIISLGVIFVYYTISITTENMIKKGLLSPFLGMWSANLFLLITGIIFYYFTSKEKTINWERLFVFADNIKERFRQRKQRRQKTKRKVILVIKFKPIRLKFRLFKIIDIYVVKKLLFTFFLIFASLIMVFYITNIVELVDDVVENNVEFFYIFEFLYYHTPEIISFVLPVSILTAVLLAFSVMSKNNEIVAVQVSGISLYRLTLPAIVIGLLLSLAYFYVQERITPGANKKKREVLNIIHKRVVKTEQEMRKNWVVGKNGEFYFYDFLDKKNNRIVNFNVIYMDENFSPNKRISAKFAKWSNDTEIILRTGFERSFRNNVPVGFFKFTSKKMNIQGGRELFTKRIAFPQYMNIKTLKRYIRYLEEKKSDTQKYEAQLYYKYAFPLSSLVMVLIAIPFSFLMGKKGTLFGIGVAIGISMFFWFTFAVFSALGSAAILSPFISAFAPLFIFAIISGYLFMNVKT